MPPSLGFWSSLFNLLVLAVFYVFFRLYAYKHIHATQKPIVIVGIEFVAGTDDTVYVKVSFNVHTPIISVPMDDPAIVFTNQKMNDLALAARSTYPLIYPVPSITSSSQLSYGGQVASVTGSFRLTSVSTNPEIKVISPPVAFATTSLSAQFGSSYFSDVNMTFDHVDNSFNLIGLVAVFNALVESTAEGAVLADPIISDPSSLGSTSMSTHSLFPRFLSVIEPASLLAENTFREIIRPGADGRGSHKFDCSRRCLPSSRYWHQCLGHSSLESQTIPLR